MPTVSLTTTLAKLVAKFAAGVVDTGGKFAANFRKKFETVLMGYSGAGGKLIYEKKPEAKNLVTLSLSCDTFKSIYLSLNKPLHLDGKRFISENNVILSKLNSSA